MNQLNLIGIVGKEPVCSVSSSGIDIAKWTLAVKRSRDREKTDWFNVTMFGAPVTSLVKPHIHKGDRIFVSGPFQFDEYEKDGVKKFSHSLVIEKIELLGSSANTENTQQEQTSNAPDPTDDLPF